MSPISMTICAIFPITITLMLGFEGVGLVKKYRVAPLRHRVESEPDQHHRGDRDRCCEF